MKKKQLVYVGHEYHKKTKSVDFLIDIFRQNYEVEYMTYDMETNQINGDKEAFEKEYDVLVLFQMPVSVNFLREKLNFQHGVYFPMYDGTGEAPNQFWLDYIDFNIINFSSTLHNRLLNMGFSSHYIQYFPKPSLSFEEGNKDSVFFWQRRGSININTVCNLFANSDIAKIHVHKALDPGEEYIEPSQNLKNKYQFTFSTWYADKKEMLEDVKKAAYYIAPREYEGIGMSFLEAMAMGKCVVAPNHPTMNEYIVNGVNGYLYKDSSSRLDFHNLREIQKNVYLYMKKGFANWEREKNKILEWLEQDVKLDSKLIEKTYKEQFIIGKHYLGGKILLVTLELGGVYRLFGKIKLPKKIVTILKTVKKQCRNTS